MAVMTTDPLHETLMDFSQQAKTERKLVEGFESVFVCREVVADLADIAPGATRGLVFI